MKRNVSQAAALSTATASQSNGRKSLSHPPVRTSPTEVDLADPGMARHLEDSTVEAFVQLEEMYPSDPGQLSGISLRILFSGEATTLNAECAAPQRDGSLIPHCLGYVDGAKLASAAASDPTDAADTFLICLRERYYPETPNAFSGATLTLFAGGKPELRVCFGSHCLGVLSGRRLTIFMYYLHRRYAAKEA